MLVSIILYREKPHNMPRGDARSPDANLFPRKAFVKASEDSVHGSKDKAPVFKQKTYRVFHSMRDTADESRFDTSHSDRLRESCEIVNYYREIC